jgi:hypothetical protein
MNVLRMNATWYERIVLSDSAKIGYTLTYRDEASRKRLHPHLQWCEVS